MTVIANATLRKLNDGGLAIGLLVKLCPTIEIARVAKACDHDFVVIDMQHGGMSIETAINASHAALDTGVTPIVRVQSKACLDAARLLDNGAMGIVVPDVETASEARHAVELCRFQPLGRRSVGAGYPQLDYAPMSTAEAIRHLNAETILIAMIESGKGVENADEIAAVEGIDVLHVGSNDLLTEMGLSGQMGTPRHYELCGRVLGAARAHGKVAGIGGARAPEQQVRFVEMGFRYLTTNSDLAFLLAGARDRAKLLRGVMPG